MNMTQEFRMAFPSPAKIFTPVVTTLIVLMIIGYALVHHLSDFTIRYLAVNPQTFLPFKIWQLVTYSTINSCPWNLIFNGMIVLFIGSAIEREWKSKSLLLFLLVVSVVCSGLWLLINLLGKWSYIGIGTGACSYGLIAAWGMIFRRQRFYALFWTLEAQHLALILIAIGLIIGIAQPISWIWVAGAAIAYLYIKMLWSMDSPSQNVNSSKKRHSGSFVDID